MKIVGFQARGDLVGRRVRVSWEFWPEEGETLASVPRVILRRKHRDFEYVLTTPAAYLVYDSGDFPPADPLALVTELPGWEERRDDGTRQVVTALSVARSIGGRNVEVTRRTLRQVLAEDGRALRQQVEILDLGGQPEALLPGEPCYYQLFSPALPADAPPEPYRATATPAENHGMGRTLYEMLPQIYRRHDVVTRPSTPGDDTVPEMAGRSGQLRRMVDLFGTALSALRSSAEGLRQLHDVDAVDARFLPLLAKWLGWELDQAASAARHRNEIKTAAKLYPTIGTLPGLRALVTQYTGWSSQVVEFAQQVVRSNQAPRYNLFASVERGGQWCGADDASPLLGFNPGNDDVSGTGTTAAQLLGTATEPFALHPGACLTLAVDGGLPSTVRFASGDFANLAAATAAEVAAALTATHDQLIATASGGRVLLATKSVGPSSALRVLHETRSLLSLEGAPAGRLSTFQQAGRGYLFFEARDAAAPPERPQLMSVGPQSTTPRETARETPGRLLYKTRVDDAWRSARVAPGTSTVSRGAPAAAPLPDGRVLLSWLESPEANEARHRFALGRPRAASPARLHGTRRGPFVLTPGTRVHVATSAGGPEAFTVVASDYANPAAATANEVASAVASQLSRARAVVEADGTLRLETLATGGAATLQVDLAQSTAARALGFGPGAAGPARGDFDDELDWSAEGWLPTVSPGRHAQLSAAWDDTVGGLRLAWAGHRGLPWKVWLSLWTGRSAIATAGGVALRSETGAITLLSTAQGLPSNDIRATALDADGTWAIATASGAVLRRVNLTAVVLNTGAGLPSNDIRDVGFEPGGGLWMATAAGAVLRRADGSLLVLTTVQGLPSNDVRRVTIDPDGGVWLATWGGLVRRHPEGALTVWTSANSGLPSSNIMAVALAANGVPWVATVSGLSLLRDGVVEPVSGPPPPAVRAIAFDSRDAVLLATASGLAIRSGDGPWVVSGTAEGLPSNDIRTVWCAPTGETWVATAAGAAVRGATGSWRRVGTTEGLPSLDVRHFSGVWSTPRVAAAGGAANVEPSLVVDSQARAWLLWSQRQGLDANDNWTLRQRRFNASTLAWEAEAALTTTPVGGRAADREPGALPGAAGALRVFFRSDRSGGDGLHWLTLSSTGTPGALNALPADMARDQAPMPLLFPDGTTWLGFRSDRGVALAQAEAPPPAFSPARSARLPDPGSLRRYAASTTVTVDDVVRNRERRAFGDLLSYTPQKPRGVPDEPLTDDDLYTRGTLGLFLSRGRVGNEITGDEVERLRSLLARFLPINARAVVIVRPEPVVELLYPAGADIVESYADNHPMVETYPVPITDSTSAVLPGWGVLHSNHVDEVSVDATDPTTLRRRTWYRPPE
ncbi:two-component regulator propeller domain-containing protein [Corallococcus coralloides]|uniref:two-component regulator propeller domain-containing protein n=1 Tax=Corallococcus coralloides TaxID=184914 RepID=UPI00384CB09E